MLASVERRLIYPRRRGRQLKLVACIVSFVLVTATNAFGEPYPHVHLVFGYVPFDQSCERWRNTKIELQWYEELQKRSRRFKTTGIKKYPCSSGPPSLQSTSPFGIKR